MNPYKGSRPNLPKVHDTKIDIRILYTNQGRTVMTMVDLPL